jgi:Na+/glutamate symporter
MNDLDVMLNGFMLQIIDLDVMLNGFMLQIIYTTGFPSQRLNNLRKLGKTLYKYYLTDLSEWSNMFSI